MSSENISGNIASSDDEIYRQVEGVHIRVSGLQEEDVFTRDGVYKEIVKTLKKVLAMARVSDLTLNVKKYHEEGSRKKYSVRIRLITDDGDFNSDDYEWDIFKAVKKTLEKLEREFFKKKSK